MTPLAHQIVKELTLPKNRRTFRDFGLLDMMDNIHCFECSEVVEISRDIYWNFRKSEDENMKIRQEIADQLGFLPAPKTWIEFKEYDVRMGILLTEMPLGLVRAYFAYTAPNDFAQVSWNVVWDLKEVESPSMIMHVGNKKPDEQRKRKIHEHTDNMYINCMGLLAMINTPKIIGRIQHMPHVGLEKKLSRSLGGKYPFHAWNEIILSIHPPEEALGEHEAHLTGTKALHFCRAHLRIKLGKIEFVRSHWRGDPALGIKQSRYKIVQ